MIYLFEQMRCLDDAKIACLLNLMPVQRAAQVRRYQSSQARRNSVVAWFLLKYALYTEHGIDLTGDFAFNAYGKPYLPASPHVHFNLSHCACAAACAISSFPIGIDVETIRPVEDKLLRFVADDMEYAQVQAAADKARAFFQLWTAKESLLKLQGTGLRRQLKPLLAESEGSVEHLYFDYHSRGYMLSVCAYAGQLSGLGGCSVQHLSVSDICPSTMC